MPGNPDLTEWRNPATIRKLIIIISGLLSN